MLLRCSIRALALLSVSWFGLVGCGNPSPHDEAKPNPSSTTSVSGSSSASASSSSGPTATGLSCRDGVRCAEWGECGGTPGTCHPVAEDDCRNAVKCAEEGLCSLPAGASTCIAGSAADCKKSKRCERSGACSLSSLACGPASDADCEGSSDCKSSGLCLFDGKRCSRTKTPPREAPSTEPACVALGGRWEGTVSGRGRLTGCSLPTKDAGKACSDARDCEGPCVDGKCYGFARYKGCGIMVDGKPMCAE